MKKTTMMIPASILIQIKLISKIKIKIKKKIKTIILNLYKI